MANLATSSGFTCRYTCQYIPSNSNFFLALIVLLAILLPSNFVKAGIEDETGFRLDGVIEEIYCRDGENNAMTCPVLPFDAGSIVTYRYTFDKVTEETPDITSNRVEYHAIREAVLKMGSYSIRFNRSIIADQTVVQIAPIAIRNDYQNPLTDAIDIYQTEIELQHVTTPIAEIEDIPLNHISATIVGGTDLLDSSSLPITPLDMSKAKDAAELVYFDTEMVIHFNDNSVSIAGELKQIEVKTSIESHKISEKTFKATGVVESTFCTEADGSWSSDTCTLRGGIVAGKPFNFSYTFDEVDVSRSGQSGLYCSIRNAVVRAGDNYVVRITRSHFATAEEASQCILVDDNNEFANLIRNIYSAGITGEHINPQYPENLQFFQFELTDNIDFDLILNDKLSGTPPDISLANNTAMHMALGEQGLEEARGIVHSLIESGNPQTPIGEVVLVDPPAVDENGNNIPNPPVSLNFDYVELGGDTTVTITPQGPPTPSGLKLGEPPVYFDLQTTATIQGSVEVCIDYSEYSFGDETTLSLQHFVDPDGDGPETEQWIDVTTSVNTDSDYICGSTNSFSPFAIVEEGPIFGLSTIGDFVWEDINANGLQQYGEPGVADVTVSLQDCNGGELMSTTTGTDGRYSFDALVAGDYQVAFTAPEGFEFSPSFRGSKRGRDSNPNKNTGVTHCFPMPDGKLKPGVDAGLVRQGTAVRIGNRVWHDVTADGIQNDGEVGVGDVTVRLMDCNGNALKTRKTNSKGKYVFKDLAAGNYRVKFIAPTGFQFSPARQGNNRAKDSDPNPNNGLTKCQFVPNGVVKFNLDAGLTN